MNTFTADVNCSVKVPDKAGMWRELCSNRHTCVLLLIQNLSYMASAYLYPDHPSLACDTAVSLTGFQA